MSDFCETHGIIHEIAPLCDPQYKSVSKRK